jgi:hypothetical protein
MPGQRLWINPVLEPGHACLVNIHLATNGRIGVSNCRFSVAISRESILQNVSSCELCALCMIVKIVDGYCLTDVDDTTRRTQKIHTLPELHKQHETD